jgi:RNA polymerase sigma-70 factor (ECF subfamily)
MAPAPDDPALDLALVRDVLSKKEAAIRQLADRLRCVPRILGALNARLGRPLDEHDLADVVQDAVYVLLRKLGEFRGEVAFEGWAFRVCRFELMNAIRHRRRRPLRESLDDDANCDPAAEREWCRMLTREALEVAIERIGGAEADALRMRHFEGLSFEDMAVRLRVTLTAVKGRYYRGLARLEAIVAEQRRKEDVRGSAP